jgi:protein TonB
MSDSTIEKSFLWLLTVSFLLHVAVFTAVSLIPEEKKPVVPEPLMVDLQDMPELQRITPREEPPVPRQAELRRRVPKEIAPKGESPREKPTPLPAPPIPRTQPTQGGEQPMRRPEKPMSPVPESSRGDLMVKPKKSAPSTSDLAKLFPSANRMARLEEGYRKKYSSEVEDGETKFLNTDDNLFGSFWRRFETSVYGVWRYPAEAARQGIEGVALVKITFNRKGLIEKVEILESSGSKILDEEVIRTLKLVGPVGSFPRGYDKDELNLITFFEYGISRGGRSLR